jgi:GTP-binding protein
MKPIVAIIGKPNVGKSTLFNRIVGKKVAITSEVAGTTRDRIYQSTKLDSLSIILVDTGGLQYGKKINIEGDVYAQTLLAIQEASLIVFLIDGSTSPTIEDEHVIRTILKAKKPYICIANKTDRRSHEAEIGEYYAMGIDTIHGVSAVHGTGVEEMKSVVEKKLRKIGFRKEKESKKNSKMISMAILGRPNVGKSSLVNSLIGQKKMIVSDIAGTTRDTVDTELMWENHQFLLKDTAGIRRKGKIGKEIEFWSILRGIKALEESDIAVLMMDASEGIVNQDAHIAGYIKDEKKGLIIVLNKTDKLTADEMDRVSSELERKLEFLPWAPVVNTSAIMGKNTGKILELAMQIHEERKKEINSNELKALLEEAVHRHAPPRTHGRTVKIYDIEYTRTNPPTFIITVSDPQLFHFSYKRYIERIIREKYGFVGTGIDIRFYEKNNNKRRKTHQERMSASKRSR